MHRIPLIFHTSAEWQKNHPNKSLALEKNKNKIFTNDLIFNIALDFWGIKTTGISNNQSHSILNKEFHIETPLTLHGKVKLKHPVQINSDLQ